LEENQAKVAQRIKVIERATNRSVTQLLEDYRGLGCVLRVAALVVGSLSDPESRNDATAIHFPCFPLGSNVTSALFPLLVPSIS